MRVIREIKVGSLVVQVRELTVGEIRAWLKDAGAASGDLVDSLLFEDFSLADLRAMTDLTGETMDSLAPVQLRTIADVAKEVNVDFFVMRSQVVAAGRAVLAGN